MAYPTLDVRLGRARSPVTEEVDDEARRPALVAYAELRATHGRCRMLVLPCLGCLECESPYIDVLDFARHVIGRWIQACSRPVGIVRNRSVVPLVLLVRHAELLEAAGVDTVKELKMRKAGNLATKMAEVNETKKLTRAVPSEKVVQGWVEQAGLLPPKISH